MRKIIDYLEVGSKVFSTVFGWGEVVAIDKTVHYSIFCKFNSVKDCTPSYTALGKRLEEYNYPELFLHEIDLTQKLPEFKKGDLVWCKEFNQDMCFWVLCNYQYPIENKHFCIQGNNKLSFEVCVPYDKRPF